MAENTNVFKSSMNALKEKVGNMEINAQTVITVLRFAMEVVEATQLKGEAQKELAIKLVRQIVVEAPISDDKEKPCSINFPLNAVLRGKALIIAFCVFFSWLKVIFSPK